MEGEREYLHKWRKLCNRVEPYSYRFFSHFMGNSSLIVPEDVARQYIERTLNPIRYRNFYSDKNLYEYYIDSKYLPISYLRRIRGGYFNKSYDCVDADKAIGMIPGTCNRLILKPSIDSCSGQGVMLFVRKDNDWESSNSMVKLSKSFLDYYGEDFVLQEALSQSDYMTQFCSTAVNTLRIATYTSPIDETVHVLGSVMRIGRIGCFIDNAHAGGMIVGVDKLSGKVGERLFATEGTSMDTWNGVCFKNNDFVIPNWDEIMDFACYVASRNKHCRFLALDVGLDKDNHPKLIEYNVDGFSYWMFMLVGQSVFGELTDEVIDYCATHKNIREQMSL